MPLDFIKLSQSHTGEYLAEMVQSVVEKFGVQNKICGIVSDNASNNAVMIDQLTKAKWPRFKGEPHWIRCFAHILNLIAKAILKPFGTERKSNQNIDNDSEDEDDIQQIQHYTNSHPDFESVEDEDFNSDEDDEGVTKVGEGEELDIEDINDLSEEEENDQYTAQNCRQTLAKFRAIARKLKKSPNSRDLFADICEAHSIQSPHRIAQDVQTRWNSTFLQLTGVNWCQKAM
ncbi:hypothetical protein PGTUg99_021388 [Puccinia graminis f. sp. tritici]|uniref:Uncharacterized protein n=1 Tax=Puccinia graminis f. sp. tritici TaxID=56615 RepID=A0A5B0RIR9_PUCGR|nr:hypothetical protein PGTUg99_021388 [Puccinia graminis f. sp. tritici]